MVLPFDDHMVHRGHGIFDTAGLINGKIYDLEAHLDRFLLLCGAVEAAISPSRAEMRDIIIKHHGGKRPPRGIHPLLAVVGTGQPRAVAGGRREPGFFVMVFAGLVYPDRWSRKAPR